MRKSPRGANTAFAQTAKPFIEVNSLLLPVSMRLTNGSFSERLKRLDDRIKEEVNNSSLFYITLALAMLIVLVFRNLVQFLLEGLFFVAVAFLVIVIAFFIWLKANYMQPSLPDLLHKKNRIVDAMEIAKQKYIHRQISKKNFDSFYREKQGQLIEVKAFIDQHSNKKSRKKLVQEVLAVKAKKRHVLKALLQEKRRVLKEIDLAEKSYLKRRLDTPTYKEMRQIEQKRLIELESEIKNLYREESESEEIQTPKATRKKRRFARNRKPKH